MTPQTSRPTSPGRQPSPYEHAGGSAAMLRLARAFHARALADPVLEHPFSRRNNPQHVERLAAYWGQALGGPPDYEALGADQSALMRMHLGEGGGEDLTDLKSRFVACVDAAADDAGLPADESFRTLLHDYVAWATGDLMPDHDDPERVPDGLAVPVWGWDGPVGDVVTSPARPAGAEQERPPR